MTEQFTPAIWPEDEAPPEAVECQKCELCRQSSRVIWGEGNPNAPVVVLLDNPGAREDKEGGKFVCGTRQTLQYAAHNAKLSMNDLYVTYVLKCRPVRRYNKEESRYACMEFLYRQIEKQRPKLAFCLGNTSVQWFFGDMEAEVKNLRGNWYDVRGIATAVSYHPLAVRRRPNLMRLFLQDWDLVANKYFEINNRSGYL